MTKEIRTLGNGVRIIADPMPGLASLAVGVWIGTGGRHERLDELGVSHFLEHMAFKGTTTRSAREIAEAAESVGGYLNAYTARTQTAYHGRFLAEDLSLALDLLADIVRRPRFDPAELERERQVILHEIAHAADTPEDVAMDLLQEAAYTDQPFGRPILGTVESVSALTVSHLRDYVARRHDPSRMIIAASGAVDPDRLEAEVARHFGELVPEREGSPEGAAATPAVFTGRDRRRQTSHEQVQLALAFEGVRLSDPRVYVSWIYAEILGGGMSSRLFQEVREARGLAYSVYSVPSAYADTGLVTVAAGTGREEAGELTHCIMAQMKSMADRVTAQEIDRAKAQMRAAVLMALESPGGRADSAASDVLAEGRIINHEEILAGVSAVDAASVTAFAGDLLTGPPPAVSVVGPANTLPDHATLQGWMRS